MSIATVKVPNIHTGDVYYVTTNENKLLAVRIKKSHICISDKSIVCDLEFPKGIVIKFGTTINRCRIRMEHNFDGKERLIMENPISTFTTQYLPPSIRLWTMQGRELSTTMR